MRIEEDVILVCQGPSLLEMPSKMEALRSSLVIWAGVTRAWIPQAWLLDRIKERFRWYWYTSKSLKPYEGKLNAFLTIPDVIWTSDSCYNFHAEIFARHAHKLRFTSPEFEVGQRYNGNILCLFCFILTLIWGGWLEGKRLFLLGCDLGATYGHTSDELGQDKAHNYQSVLCTLADEMNRDVHGVNRFFEGVPIFNASPKSTLTLFPRITQDEMIRMINED